jgi:hypothetical protein
MGRMPGAVRDCHAGPAESSIAIEMAHPSMSALGALPPKADIGTRPHNVCFVPKADILHRSNYAYSITSSAATSIDVGRRSMRSM